MKKLFTLLFCALSIMIDAQQPALQYFRSNNKDGLNVFETSKQENVEFTGLKVRLGGDFAMQFQSLDQSNSLNNLVDLESNLNLPTANLNVDVQLLDGVRMHLKTYLSSKHHSESWVKGGHLQIDKLDFVSPGFLEGIMKYTTVTVGLDEFDYGDAHFRRTDNARAIFNPFVGNYIMDAFSTEAFGQVTFQGSGFLAVVGVTNGKLNQSVVRNSRSDNKVALFGKIGFDQTFSDRLRFRLTGSIYSSQGTTNGTWLYGGDRSGSRYYKILQTLPDADGNTQGGDFEGRFNARFTKLTAIQFNPFIKIMGLELFGIYELASGSNQISGSQAEVEGAFTQLAGEVLFRFGQNERFYLGGRYNTVYGKSVDSAPENLEITRINVGGGWFLSKNIVTKVEYVLQEYVGDAWTGRFAGAKFQGINVEAAISF